MASDEISYVESSTNVAKTTVNGIYSELAGSRSPNWNILLNSYQSLFRQLEGLDEKTPEGLQYSLPIPVKPTETLYEVPFLLSTLVPPEDQEKMKQSHLKASDDKAKYEEDVHCLKAISRHNEAMSALEEYFADDVLGSITAARDEELENEKSKSKKRLANNILEAHNKAKLKRHGF